jgi:exopolyphosphatase/guanosine-5'-triphosphate,3'-diphosphate pyrophosphatase
VHGLRLGRAEVERQLGVYLASPLRARRAIVGLDPKRADVIPGGAAVVARALVRLEASELVVSDRGIRWALAYELAECTFAMARA